MASDGGLLNQLENSLELGGTFPRDERFVSGRESGSVPELDDSFKSYLTYSLKSPRSTAHVI